MKIAFVTSFPKDPESPKGGVEAVSVTLVRALARHSDLDLHVLTLREGLDHATATPWEGATIHAIPRPPGSMLGVATGTGQRAVREAILRLGPDLIHAHDTYGIMVQGIPIPRVFTIHGFIYGDTLVSGKKFPWLRARLWKAVEQRAWADQPHIVSISPYVRERLAGIATGVIHDIDNPIAERFFDLPRNDAGRVVFSAAVISPRKNPAALVDAVAILRDRGTDVELRLAGPEVDPGYAGMLRRRIAELRLEPCVRLLGRVGSEGVREELSAASVFALVSLEENSPLGIEEAMAASVPVVTSNRCGMPYMVRHGESGFLVEPNDAAGIAERIGRILNDRPLRTAMGEKGRQVALDRFHPSAVAARTREVYLEAVGSGPGRNA